MHSLKNYLIVKVIKEDVTEHGIILTTELPKAFKKAKVIAISEKEEKHKVGDTILLGYFVGKEIEIERENYLLVRCKDVAATW